MRTSHILCHPLAEEVNVGSIQDGRGGGDARHVGLLFVFSKSKKKKKKKKQVMKKTKKMEMETKRKRMKRKRRDL